MPSIEELQQRIIELEEEKRLGEKEKRRHERIIRRQERQLEQLDKMVKTNESVDVRLFYELDQISKQLEAEKQKSEKLLLNILPKSIAERLKTENKAIADGFESVTVLFSDIVGFTNLSTHFPPETLVQLLNELFSIFDDLTESHDLEKIKTIGDAYMVAGGLPEPQEYHTEAIADLALEMKQGLARFNEEHHMAFDLRVGIHTGPAVAGVIGINKFVYDIWGDTVNTASRMESHGIPGQIQVSQQTYEHLKSKYVFQERGVIEVKGKGEMRTYLLQGKHESIA